MIDQPLEAVDFAMLFFEGVRLANAGKATEADSDLPPLAVPAREALGSLLRLHGPFVLATAEGTAVIAAEERFQRRPAEEVRHRESQVDFARSLRNRPDIIVPAAAAAVRGAAEQTGRGPNPERSGVIATGMVGNVIITLVAGATVAACPVIGNAVGGAGLVVGGLVGLLASEIVKKSEAFIAVTKPVTALINKSGTDLEREFRDNFGRFLDFVLNADDKLRLLSGQRPEFSWVVPSLDWIRSCTDRQTGGAKEQPLPIAGPEKQPKTSE